MFAPDAYGFSCHARNEQVIRSDSNFYLVVRPVFPIAKRNRMRFYDIFFKENDFCLAAWKIQWRALWPFNKGNRISATTSL